MKPIKPESVRTIEDGLLEWCNSRLHADLPITVDTDLLDGGYLDSLFVMNMIAHLEKQYGVTIDSAEISPANFRTVAALAELVTGNAGG